LRIAGGVSITAAAAVRIIVSARAVARAGLFASFVGGDRSVGGRESVSRPIGGLDSPSVPAMVADGCVAAGLCEGLRASGTPRARRGQERPVFPLATASSANSRRGRHRENWDAVGVSMAIEAIDSRGVVVTLRRES